MDHDLHALLDRVAKFHGAAREGEVARAPEDKRAMAVALATGALEQRGPRFVALPGTDQRIVTARRFGARLTCASAAEVLGYGMWHPAQRTHLALPRNHAVRASGSRDLQGVVLHRCREMTPMTVDDYPLVVPAEAVACALRCLDELDAICVADAALNRGGITREEVLELLPGRRNATARARLTRATAKARSILETRVRLALEPLGVPLEPGAVIEGVGEVDLLVAGWLIVEADSWEFHSSKEQFQLDRHRDQVALSQGLVPMRLVWEDIQAGESAIRRVISRALLGVAHFSEERLPENRGILRKVLQAAE